MNDGKGFASLMLGTDGVADVKRASIAHVEYDSVLAADSDIILTAVTDTGSSVDITTFAHQPDFARVITATAGGTASSIKNISVIVEGTNLAGDIITETLPAFTVNTAGTKTGVKAFATVTKVTIPAHDATSATTAIGVGDILGLPYMLTNKVVLATYLNGALEGTAPTLVADSDELEKNTAVLNTALDGNSVDLYLIVN